jgi:hypothetical protein
VERSTKDAWLNGPSDLREDDVEDVPTPGQSVRVRGLSAAYSNHAISEALEMKQGRRGEQTGSMNMAKLEVLQFAHGCIDPEFTVEEAQQIAERFGPAFKRVIAKIDGLSGVDKEAAERTNAMFPVGGTEQGNGRSAGVAPVGVGDD